MTLSSSSTFAQVCPGHDLKVKLDQCDCPGASVAASATFDQMQWLLYFVQFPQFRFLSGSHLVYLCHNNLIAECIREWLMIASHFPN